jgi:hypothetical protein
MSNISEQAIDSGKAAKPDAFTPWYTIWTSAFFLLAWLSTDLDRIFSLYIMLVPVIALPGLVLIATLLISFGVNAFKRRWRRALSILAAPIIAAFFFSLLGWLGVTTERIRLEWWKSSYLAEIAALPPSADGIRLKTWDWGETGGAAVANFFWTLVYDESDQIALPPSGWSTEWLQKADKSGGIYSVIHHTRDDEDYYRRFTVRHLTGHFYVVEELIQ